MVATASRRERVYKWAEASARREAASRKPTEQRSNYASGIIATIAKFATARSARKASRACFFAEEERKRCRSLQSHSCGCMTAALCATSDLIRLVDVCCCKTNCSFAVRLKDERELNCSFDIGLLVLSENCFKRIDYYCLLKPDGQKVPICRHLTSEAQSAVQAYADKPR